MIDEHRHAERHRIPLRTNHHDPTHGLALPAAESTAASIDRTSCRRDEGASVRASRVLQCSRCLTAIKAHALCRLPSRLRHSPDIIEATDNPRAYAKPCGH